MRVYNLSNDSDYYYFALKYYRIGACFCKKNLYCPRNYCALLLRIYEITKDKDIIKEYYYTAKHFAKLYLDINVNGKNSGSYDEHIYYTCNVADLNAIINDAYINAEEIVNRIQNNRDISKRQRSTIVGGINTLKKSIENINRYIEYT